MGITGLLPFLKKANCAGNVRQLAGKTVAVDVYCWLHKGAFACAEALALGKPTDQYVKYCLKYTKMLLHNNIKVILVFDGANLPAKAATETKRRENRNNYRRKAAQFLLEGKKAEARECFERCINVTHEMALDVMNAARNIGVDCIVAPYEADSQLAYLNRCGIADVVITEDSDLTLFGCTKIAFKLDLTGTFVLYERNMLPLACSIKPEQFTFDKFRYMCILSGCDYFSGFNGVGLVTASKVMQKTRLNTFEEILNKLGMYMARPPSNLTQELILSALEADNTFRFQIVFDPIKRQQCPLNPYPVDRNFKEYPYAGVLLEKDDETAFQMALGNLDFYTLKRVNNYNPDNFIRVKYRTGLVEGFSVRKNSFELQPKHPVILKAIFPVEHETVKNNPSSRDITSFNKGSHSQRTKQAPHLLSIWSADYRPLSTPSNTPEFAKTTEVPDTFDTSCTRGRKVIVPYQLHSSETKALTVSKTTRSSSMESGLNSLLDQDESILDEEEDDEASSALCSADLSDLGVEASVTSPIFKRSSCSRSFSSSQPKKIRFSLDTGLSDSSEASSLAPSVRRSAESTTFLASLCPEDPLEKGPTRLSVSPIQSIHNMALKDFQLSPSKHLKTTTATKATSSNPLATTGSSPATSSNPLATTGSSPATSSNPLATTGSSPATSSNPLETAGSSPATCKTAPSNHRSPFSLFSWKHQSKPPLVLSQSPASTSKFKPVAMNNGGSASESHKSIDLTDETANDSPLPTLPRVAFSEPSFVSRMTVPSPRSDKWREMRENMSTTKVPPCISTNKKRGNIRRTPIGGKENKSIVKQGSLDAFMERWTFQKKEKLSAATETNSSHRSSNEED